MPSSPTSCFPVLAGLAARLRNAGQPLVEHWDVAHERFAEWVAGVPDLPGALRAELRALSTTEAAAIAARSGEATTHFAWRLVDEPADLFSLWLHEYKPRRDWLPGYANTVHNHRYHLCTTILAGGYRHEWFDVELDRSRELVRGVALAEWELCRPGAVFALTADRFHRIPQASDGTFTFLVKSRPVKRWSLSLDPITKVCRRHVPVEVRIGELADRL